MMLSFLSGNLLNGALAFTLLIGHASAVPHYSPAVQINLFENNEASSETELPKTHSITEAAKLPISYNKCYYLSNQYWGRLGGETADEWNVITFKRGSEEKRIFKICHKRYNCFNFNRAEEDQAVRAGAGFWLWDYQGMLGSPDPTRLPNYIGSDGSNWLFPTGDAWPEVLLFKAHFHPDDEDEDSINPDANSPILRVSLKEFPRSATSLMGLEIHDDNHLYRCDATKCPPLKLKFHEVECPRESDDGGDDDDDDDSDNVSRKGGASGFIREML